MLKIENKQVTPQDSEWRDFLFGIRDLKVGQSFVLPTFSSNYRIAVSVLKTVVGREFVTRKEKNGYRVGRIK